MVDKARAEADAVRAAAQQERNLTVEGAISTRERILEDLSRRRRVASVQIEQLRAGRERLLESYAVVRRTLEEVNDELNRADAEARAAADEVGRRMQRESPSRPESAADRDRHAEAEPGGRARAGASARPRRGPATLAAPRRPGSSRPAAGAGRPGRAPSRGRPAERPARPPGRPPAGPPACGVGPRRHAAGSRQAQAGRCPGGCRPGR